MSDEQINQLWDDMIEAASVGVIDMDEVMAATASSMRGVSSDHLSKVWRISREEADDTIKITSQNKIHSADPQLAKNYGTNDRMLQYKHINEYFFMDTFLATKKGGVLSRGNTFCQLFVSGKTYLYAVPMKARREVLQAVKLFAKEVGAPDEIICDPTGTQISAP